MASQPNRAMGAPVTDKTRDAARLWPTLVFLVLVVAYWFIAWAYQGMATYTDPPAAWQTIIQQYPLLDTATPFVTLLAGLISPRVLRHFVPVIAGAAFAYITAVALLQALYTFTDSADARALLSRLQSGTTKAVEVSRDQLESKRQADPLLRVGGPGSILVPGNEVAVTEINGRYNRVLGPGKHKLARFETIRSILDLREQSRSQDEIVVTTREGLRVKTDLTVTFRIMRGNRMPTRSDPFPYLEDAVREASYSEIIHDDGYVTGWDVLPLEIAIHELNTMVGSLRMDELVDPHKRQPDPQPTVQNSVQRNARHKLFNYGIELISARIGALHLPPDVHKTLLTYWSKTSERPEPHMAPTPAEMNAQMAAIRATIREDMIEALAQGLKQVQDSADQTAMRHEVMMAYRVVDTLNRMLQLPQGQDKRLSELMEQLESPAPPYSSLPLPRIVTDEAEPVDGDYADEDAFEEQPPPALPEQPAPPPALPQPPSQIQQLEAGETAPAQDIVPTEEPVVSAEPPPVEQIPPHYMDELRRASAILLGDGDSAESEQDNQDETA